LIGAIAGTLGPAQGQTPSNARKKTVPDLKPFDVSYLPPKSYSILAFRPDAIFGRQDMKRYPRLIEGFIRTCIGLVDQGNAPLKLEGIKQVVLGSVRPPATRARTGPGRRSRDV
jgi:hypothetical protein